MNLSYKDLLLVIGVVVALIIGATALLYKESDKKESKQVEVAPKTSLVTPSVLVKRLF